MVRFVLESADEHVSTLTLTAGLSSSLPDQVKQILEVVGTALRSVSSSRRKQLLRSHERADRIKEKERITKQVQERIRRGVWHEPFEKRDEELVTYSHEIEAPTPTPSKREGSKTPDVQEVSILPVVVLKNYSTGGKEEVMGVFAKWAAALVEGKVRLEVICARVQESNELTPADCSCHSHRQ